MLKKTRMMLRSLLGLRRAESELDEELRFHLEQEAQLNMTRGMSPADAHRQARIALGGVESTKEVYRDGRGTRGVEEFLADARYAARALWHDKALATAGIVTLALGIGATTAVFSAVNAVMLRDLPFQSSGELVSIWEENKPRGWVRVEAAPANYLDWKERTSTFADIAAYTDYPTTLTLLGEGEPRLLTATYVTGNFFATLGVRPLLGRFFVDADTWDDGQRPMVLSAALWRQQFNGDTSIIGREIWLGGARRWRVIGVAPAAFAFPHPGPDLYLPTLFSRESRAAVGFRRAHWIRVIGRLKPGVTAATANADLQAVVSRLKNEFPETNANMGAGMTPIREAIVGDTRRPLVILLAAAAVLLIIACANVGNLLLVHAVGRTRETSLRFVLGATRGRVIRQSVTQSLVLSLSGGVAGLALGWVGARLLLALQPQGLLPVTAIPLDATVWVFTLLLASASGVLFGLAPAVIATRLSPATALAAGGRSVLGGGARRWAQHLVVTEVALAALLMVGAGLLVRSYRNVSNVPGGFDGKGVLTAGLNLPNARYDSTKVRGFYRTLLDRLRAEPGVASVGAVRQLPLGGVSWSSSLAIKGNPILAEGADVLHREVMGDYFNVMRVPLRRGRYFDATDTETSAPVAIINETLARQFFADADPVGRQITYDRVPDSTSLWRTVVGVVGDEHQASLVAPPRPEVFAPQIQDPTNGLRVVVRANDGLDPMSLAGAVRRTVADLDSLLAINRMRPMSEVEAESMTRQRFMSVLVVVFAVTGMALAIVGVFGVLAQLVQARTREMGLRIALGAQPSQVRWMVIRHGLTLMIGGVAVGLVAALGLTRVMTSMLFGVSPVDAFSYAAAGLALIMLGMLAAAVPAARASTADPAVALRAE